MPFQVSDITANYMQGDNGDEDGFIIITGGCDAANGNERLAPNLFACTSTSTKTLLFDPFSGTFQSMADAPRPRQRHAAAVSNGELYVFGGRDSDDNLVPEIDVSHAQLLLFKYYIRVPYLLLPSMSCPRKFCS